jgi:hypothetical protein
LAQPASAFFTFGFADVLVIFTALLGHYTGADR